MFELRPVCLSSSAPMASPFGFRLDFLTRVGAEDSPRSIRDPTGGSKWLNMTFVAGNQPPVLAVEDLRTEFGTREGSVYAVNGVNFHVHEGELLGIVGESGSGKSVTMMSLLKLVPMPPARITSGRVMFGGRDLLQLPPSEVRRVRGGEIGFIFQDPMTLAEPGIYRRLSNWSNRCESTWDYRSPRLDNVRQSCSSW